MFSSLHSHITLQFSEFKVLVKIQLHLGANLDIHIVECNLA